MELQRCNGNCKKKKPNAEFGYKVKRGVQTDVLHKTCEECRNLLKAKRQTPEEKEKLKARIEKTKEQRKEYIERWREENKEKTQSYTRYYREANKEEVAKSQTKYWNEVVKDKRKNDIDTKIKFKITMYKQQDKKRGHTCDLDCDFIKSLLTNCDFHCKWCNIRCQEIGYEQYDNDQWTMDRIDNQQGHTKANVVVACLRCNYSRH